MYSCVKKWERRGQGRQTRWSEHENQGENIDETRRVRVCVCVVEMWTGRRGEVRMTEARGTETARHGAVKKSAFGGRKGMEKWRRKKKKERERQWQRVECSKRGEEGDR